MDGPYRCGHRLGMRRMVVGDLPLQQPDHLGSDTFIF